MTERRQSRQLEAVWRAVKDDATHPTADRVFEKVRSQIPNISLGTVYRNLKRLVAEGRLGTLDVGRAQRFDPMTQPHEHFICERCGGVYDLFVDARSAAVSAPPPAPGFTVTSRHLALYGVCPDCAA
jgi:Fur family peroxide stress response transcriptional regulator